jgi:hypothetical protein
VVFVCAAAARAERVVFKKELDKLIGEAKP